MSEPERTPISEDDYEAPAFEKKAFHCPFCGVYTTHAWNELVLPARLGSVGSDVHRARCSNCSHSSFWFDPRDPYDPPLMMHPRDWQQVPRPHADMPGDVRRDYEEARAIVASSPRGAAALLRLAVQKLCVALGEKGKKIDDDIASLVKKGLDPQVQQALDVLRVIGNNAVHPGEIQLDDDVDTATSLFGLVNFIVDQCITRPRKLATLYENLPEGARRAIEERDGK